MIILDESRENKDYPFAFSLDIDITRRSLKNLGCAGIERSPARDSGVGNTIVLASSRTVHLCIGVILFFDD